MIERLLSCVVVFLGATLIASAEPAKLPFDFSRSEIAIEITIKGTKLHALLDTGVDPSVIDEALAKSLGLKIDRKAGGGEISGVGNQSAPVAYPTTITGLTIGGRGVAPFEAITTDMKGLSAHYGSRLDAILGFSFLDHKATLIDYPNRTVTIWDQTDARPAQIRLCKRHFSEPMRFLKDENWPLITNFRFGAAKAPVSLDTGANGDIWLLQAALAVPGLKSALVPKGTTSSAGFRGSAQWKSYSLNEPIGFGPFELPPGQMVTVRDEKGSLDSRVANVGNRQFAALKVKMLLDYSGHQLAFYGDCQ